MALTFNADEIFEMAEEIERNGAKFYRDAAKKTADKDTEKLLRDLAAMEDGHLQTFQEMRKGLAGREKEQLIYDPDNEALRYLQFMADSHGTEGKKSLTEKLSGTETIRQILEIAVDAEKDSILFYSGLKDFVPPRAGRDKLEAVIQEEFSHVTTLKEKLNALK